MNTPAPSSSAAVPGPAPAWCLWRNSILRRYCRTRLRPRGFGASLLIVLLIAGFIFALCRTIGLRQIETASRYTAEGIGMHIPSLVDIERYCLLPLLVFQVIIIFFVGTGQAAGGMTADADEGTMDYMRLSPMTPLSKVLGYLLGLPVREWLLFAATLPFTAWGLWRGQVPWENWLPVYAVILSAAVLYHLTGLTAGTVLKNRRWAFLISMGSVLFLYLLVPQLANLGLVYFEYLTIWPVVTENMHAFLPETAGAAMKAARQLTRDAGFFNLGFPQVAFTIFSQQVLCLTFIVMLWRRWRRSESHLLSKVWATGFCAWIQVLLLGCSWPLIEEGLIFVSRRINMRFRSGRFLQEGWRPELSEALLMITVYGTVTLLSVIILGLLIAPGRDAQDRGLRRLAKLGKTRHSPFSDEAASSPFVTVMALAGAAGWSVFAWRLISSHWFPGQVLPAWTPAVFTAVLLCTGLCCVLLYELRGIKGLFLGAIFAGVVPILAGIVMAAADSKLATASVWITTASPLLGPANAVTTVLPDSIGPQDAVRLAAPRAFALWQGILLAATAWLFFKHREERKARHSSSSVPVPAA